MIGRVFLALVLSMGLTACVSMTNEPDPPPQLTESMPVDELITVSLKFGGQTLKDAKKIIKAKQKWGEVGTKMEARLMKSAHDMETPQLVNAMHLFLAAKRPARPNLFAKLLRGEQPVARQLAWQLAALRPSRPMGEMIEKELTRSLLDNEEQQILIPEMAIAVRRNGLKSAYSWMRQGLMETGNEEFFRSMMQMDPKQASEDGMDYLARAPVEELRQLTVSTVNVYTCLVILQHMRSSPIMVTHRNFPHLFLFAISRNSSFATLAKEVLDPFLGNHGQHLAFVMARMPTWIQVAFIESSRRRMRPQVRLFLSELKKVSSQNEVIDEINELQL